MLVLALVPDAAGQNRASRISLVRVVTLPGVGVILAVVVTWMLAHNTVYTYFATYLRGGSTSLPIDVALVTFGVTALAGIGVTGALVDRAIRALALSSIALFVVAGIVLIVGERSLVAVLIAIVLWGIAFGGAAAQLLTAIGRVTGENADVANGLLGVSFNVAIFGAGLLGAGLIGAGNGLTLPAVMIVLAAIALTLVAVARHTAFPRGR